MGSLQSGTLGNDPPKKFGNHRLKGKGAPYGAPCGALFVVTLGRGGITGAGGSDGWAGVPHGSTQPDAVPVVMLTSSRSSRCVCGCAGGCCSAGCLRSSPLFSNKKNNSTNPKGVRVSSGLAVRKNLEVESFINKFV